MRQSRKKHAVLILLLLLIALVSTGLMTKHRKIEKRSRMTVVLPKNEPEDLSELQDGIRDYEYDHQVKLDVWYKEQMSAEELKKLIKEEKKNNSKGVVLVYPENYLEKQADGYVYKDVLAVTDRMQKEFKYYASFAESKEKAYRLPVKTSVLEQVKNGKKKEILLENTYKLGYESMKMKTITLKPIKLDRETMESGKYDALFAG